LIGHRPWLRSQIFYSVSALNHPRFPLSSVLVTLKDDSKIYQLFAEGDTNSTVELVDVNEFPGSLKKVREAQGARRDRTYTRMAYRGDCARCASLRVGKGAQRGGASHHSAHGRVLHSHRLVRAADSKAMVLACARDSRCDDRTLGRARARSVGRLVDLIVGCSQNTHRTPCATIQCSGVRSGQARCRSTEEAAASGTMASPLFLAPRPTTTTHRALALVAIARTSLVLTTSVITTYLVSSVDAAQPLSKASEPMLYALSPESHTIIRSLLDGPKITGPMQHLLLPGHVSLSVSATARFLAILFHEPMHYQIWDIASQAENDSPTWQVVDEGKAIDFAWAGPAHPHRYAILAHVPLARTTNGSSSSFLYSIASPNCSQFRVVLLCLYLCLCLCLCSRFSAQEDDDSTKKKKARAAGSKTTRGSLPTAPKGTSSTRVIVKEFDVNE